MQDDGIIKNPARQDVIPDFTYVPEYVKMGIPTQPYVGVISGSPPPSMPVNYYQENALSGHIIDNNQFFNFDFTNSNKINKQVPDVGEYVLMVMGKVINFGHADDVINQAKSILYGNDPGFTNQQISMNDILIFKRLGLKVGVFVDE